MSNAVSACGSLASRELKHFFRQKGRIIAALATPLILWLIAGLGLGESFQAQSGIDNYLEYFFPGMIVLTVVFSAIFGAFSTIQDKQEGFMQAVLVAPVPRWSIVAGKVVGGATIAAIQGAIWIPLGFLLDIDLSPAAAIAMVLWIVLIAVGQAALGLAASWWTDSTQSFHGVMNVVLMPMWVLSGAAFPMDTAYKPIQWMMTINPLHYGVAGLRRAMYSGAESQVGDHMPSDPLCLTVTIAFALVFIAISAIVISKRPFTPVKTRKRKRR